MPNYRGRFAPSPTGDLHLGSAMTALLAWLRARQAGGRFILRVEDLDTPRVIAGSEGRQLEDLRWLGIEWDEGPDVGGPCGPYRQSERGVVYEAAIDRLARAGLLYFCDCSRADLLVGASAPHAGEEGPRYPGTCRRFGLQPRPWRRPPAIRIALPAGEVVIEDEFQGTYRQDVAGVIGDFVLKRGDGIYTYQLAVVVDDAEMGITEVVRGVDLLSSAPRQALLAYLLGYTSPHYAHVPLVVGEDGARLEKRKAAHTLRGQREQRVCPESLRARLAALAGLSPAVAAAGSVGTDWLLALVGRREVRLKANVE